MSIYKSEATIFSGASMLEETAFIIIQIKPVVPIPSHLTAEIQSKLAYVDESIHRVQVAQDQIIIEVNTVDQPFDNDFQTLLVEKVQKVVVSMVKGAIQPKIQFLEDHLDRAVPGNEDPMVELLRRGEISKEDTGLFCIGPLLTSLIAYFERQFLDLADSFQAVPYRFPTLIPARYLERVNYFRSFPHSLTFATHLREDLDVIDSFSQHACCNSQGDLFAPADSFAPIKALLSPAVCYHLYFALADKALQGGELVATAVGNCFRYEAINLVSLERLWNFTMREIIFVGSKDFVLDNREVARQRMARLLEKIGMAYRVESANDPFFIGEFRKQAAL
jgi:hypothetical protein